jgi:hypothetical protein
LLRKPTGGGAAMALPVLSGPATPSAMSMLSRRISCGSGGSSSLRFRVVIAVLSYTHDQSINQICTVKIDQSNPQLLDKVTFISQRTLKSAGFIRWEFKVCFRAWQSQKSWVQNH